MASSPDAEIEYWDDGDAMEDEPPTNINTEMQQQIAEEIKQQQLEQQQIQNRSINNNNLIENKYSYNDIITLKDGREGKIKFIGTLGFQSDTWCGLILSTPTGTHNGIVKNRKYWNCKSNHGTFVKRNHISRIKLHRIGERFSIHEKVKTPKGKGYIRFIGNIHNINDKNNIEQYHENPEQDINDNKQVMYGIELIDQMGQNSGSINGEYYFGCAHYRGIFYTEKDLIWVAPDAPPTPRISRKYRKKKKKRRKNQHQSDEIIGLDENNESIDLDAFDVERYSGSDDSISDSTSDEDFLSADDVKRLTLVANGKIDDRMSFARILHDFKNVQKSKVKNMTQQWEVIAKQRYSIDNNTSKEKSEVELATELINESKRKRAGTLPQKQTIASSPIYQPPKFADSMIQRSKQYRNNHMNKRKNKTKEIIKKTYGYGTQSTPVSPYKTPAGNPKLHKSTSTGNKSVSAPSNGFAKIRPMYKGKRKTRKKKVQFDEVGSSVDMISPRSSVDDFTMGPKSPSPITLSPATSNHIIREEVDIEQEEPLDIQPNKSRNSIEQYENNDQFVTHKIPFSQLIQSTDNNSSSTRNKRTSSAPVSKHNKVTNITTISNGTGYHSPGIISPGGGMPSLTLQNSHSCEPQQIDSVAVVDEIDKNKKKNNSNGSGGSGMAMPSPEQLLTSGSLSPTTANVYSWVFKPSDDKKQDDKFKLKLKPDSPFDICSTQKDFQKVSEILMLECNNPKNLFKVLKGVCSKLKLSNPKYRRIDTMNSAVQNKLLRFEGAEEFLQLLGFTQNARINPTFWMCDMDQPPLSVLESAINICNDCLLKCNNKRATMDMLKKFSKHDLRSHHKKRKKKRSSRKHKNSSKNLLKKTKSVSKSMDTLSETSEMEDHKKQLTNNNNNNVIDIGNIGRHRNGSVNVDGTVINVENNTKKPSNITITPTPNHLHPTDSFDIDDTDNPHHFDTQDSPGSNGGNNNNKTYMDRMQLPQMNLKKASIKIDDATETLSNLDDIKFELELEGGDEDRFQLSDIIWSITHKDNTDKDAKGIILLCFPTFSNSEKLIRCLIERFFEPEIASENSEISSRGMSRESSISYSGGGGGDVSGAHEDSESNGTGAHSPKSSSVTVSTSTKFELFMSGTSDKRIESLWEVQVKVISFLQQWMRTYWQEDWDNNDKMLDIVENFGLKIENCYKNDPNINEKDVKKGMKLIKMIHQCMDFQEASLRSKKKKNSNFMRQMSVPAKFERLTEMSSNIKKMRYDFVKLDNKRLAEQITLLDFKYFQAIAPRECLGQHWKKRNKYEVAPNICALIDQFNKMSKWVQATILLAKKVKTRGRIIKKFIKISNHLLALRNFQSLCAFHGALSSVPIHKLKHAWTYVPAKHIARFEEMRVIFNTRNNMGNLRKLHREAHAPLVPYTGIFLSDLVSIEEGNKKHKDDGTVNFAKLMRLSNAIDNILLYQRTQYEIQDDIAVQSLLLEDFKINAKLDADYIYKFANDVARKDQQKNKKQKSVLKLGIFSK